MNVDAQTDTDGILSCEMHSNDLKDELTVISYVLLRLKSYGPPPGTRLIFPLFPSRSGPSIQYNSTVATSIVPQHRSEGMICIWDPDSKYDTRNPTR